MNLENRENRSTAEKSNFVADLLGSPLSRKGLFYFAVPMMSSILIIIGLKVVLSLAQAQTEKENKSKQIVWTANMLGTAGVTVVGNFYLERVLKKNPLGTKFQDEVAKVRMRMTELEALVPQEGPQRVLCNEIHNQLEEGLTLILAPTHQEFTLPEMLIRRRKMGSLTTSLLSNCTKLVNFEERQQKKPAVSSEAFRLMIDAFLWVGFIINVVFAVLMAVFGRDITARLKVLMENSRRVVAQQELKPIARKDDEIGQLDQVLRESALLLSMARAQEKAIVDHLQSVFEAMPLALLVVSADGIVQSINQAAEDHFKETPDKLVGKSVLKLFKQRDGEALKLTDFFTEEEDLTMKIFGVRSNGETFPAEVIDTEYDTRDLKGRLLICADVSKEYEIEKLKQSFIAMVSHELRSPLMSVNVCLEMLERGFLGELTADGTKTVATAGRSVQRLISLVNEILDAERLESGSISILTEAINLEDVFQLSVSSISALADTKRIKVEADEPDIEMMADSDRLVQVIVNFLSNAIKFSPEGATVKLKAERDDDTVEVSVIDQGRGIPQEHLELIFERFHQVEHDDAKLKGGTGLGLAIARAIVDGHHGKIGVDSKLGEGSRFWFKLPIKSPFPD